MNERYTVSTQYETKPTGAPFEKKLSELVTRLEGKETVSMSSNPNATGTFLVVTRDEKDYRVTVETSSGEQNKGFLVDVQVVGRDDCSQQDAKAVFRSVEEALHDVFDVKRETV